jgi:hypothetical protein
MPLEYTWFLDGRIVLMQGSGILTTEDFAKEEIIMRQFLDQAPKIHILIDDRQLDRFPPISVMRSSQWIQDQRVGWFIIFGLRNRLLSVIASTLMRVFGVNGRIFGTFEESIAFLQKVDETLPNLTTLPQPKLVK